MKRVHLIALVPLVAFSTQSHCQFRNGAAPAEKFPALHHGAFRTGLDRAFRPYDFALVGLAAGYFIRPDDADDHLNLRPFTFERGISTGTPVGNQSLGSRLHPAYLQAAIVVGQLGIVSALDAFTDADISPEDYERPFVFMKTMLYTYGVTEITKNWVARTRPDGSDDRSFFSGHTSGTFAMSAFVYRELSDWMNSRSGLKDPTERTLLNATAFAACYGWAAYVGYARIHDRAHYLSDVLVGAAVGTAIGNIMYDLHFGAPGYDQSLRIGFTPSTQPTVSVQYTF